MPSSSRAASPRGEALGPRPADTFASLCDSALAGISALSPAAALRDSLAIAVELAVQGGTGSAVLAALTGRGGLVGDFGVLG